MSTIRPTEDISKLIGSLGQEETFREMDFSFKRKSEKGKHFSECFYEEAKERGYAYACRPHTPGFVTTERDLEFAAFDKKRQLYDLPFIKTWRDERFITFELNEYTGGDFFTEYLVVVYQADDKHWVAGYFADLNKPYKVR